MEKFLKWCKTPLGIIVCIILIAILLTPSVLALFGVITAGQFINISVIYAIAIGLAVISPLYLAAAVMGILYFAEMCLMIGKGVKWCWNKIFKHR